MKTLYINIDNTATSSNEYVAVINYSLCDDFYFHIGEKIAGEYADETNLISLIADFNAPENSDAFAKIFNQWKEIKSILFGDSPHGEYVFELPKAYLTWLRYHTNEVYHKIYRSYFADKPTASITLNIEELYNDVVPLMDRELLYTIDKNENSKNFNWIVLADEAITKRIPLMYKMSKRYKAHTITIKQWYGLALKEYTKNTNIGKILSYETFTRTKAYEGLNFVMEYIDDLCFRLEKESFNPDKLISRAYELGCSPICAEMSIVNEEMSSFEKATSLAITKMVKILTLSVESLCSAKKMNVPQINREKVKEQLSVLSIVDELRGDYILGKHRSEWKLSNENLSSKDIVAFTALGLNSEADRLKCIITLCRHTTIECKSVKIKEELRKRVRNSIDGIMYEARKLNQTHYYSNVNIN